MERLGGVGENERQECTRWFESHKGRRGIGLMSGCSVNSESEEGVDEARGGRTNSEGEKLEGRWGIRRGDR